ncbi:MAG TPA: Gfo/Idh/MocA family oxidoreductase [Planctomycetota bacterium]|jgi:hypothetical protein
MAGKFSRRSFLKGAAAVAGASALGGPYVMADAAPNSKLNCVVIGCGRRGAAHIEAAAHEKIVAYCDVDENNSAKAIKWVCDEGNAKKYRFAAHDPSKIKTFVGYRKLFDEMPKDFDAVFIATPDHQHALAAMMAMKAGKHVYCEKPLTYSVYEARKLGETAKECKVATQMGNQGHASEATRVFVEYIQAGAIGKVLETHSWKGTQYAGGIRPPTKPVPKGLNWDEWLGPAPFREYHDGLHTVGWLGWWDFAAYGMLGGWGHHVLDGVFFALKPGLPVSCEMVDMRPGNPEGFPAMDVLRWDFPARGDMPPLKMFWYDGAKKGSPRDHNKANVEPDYKKEDEARPPLVVELEKKYGRNFGGAGTLYVGEKGYMVTGDRSDGPRIIPEEQHKAFPKPAPSIPRIARTEGSGGELIFDDFIQAAKGRATPPCSNFTDYSGPFTEAMLAAKLAAKAGVGKKVEWDGKAMKCTNMPELNQWVTREYRKGWEM